MTATRKRPAPRSSKRSAKRRSAKRDHRSTAVWRSNNGIKVTAREWAEIGRRYSLTPLETRILSEAVGLRAFKDIAADLRMPMSRFRRQWKTIKVKMRTYKPGRIGVIGVMNASYYHVMDIRGLLKDGGPPMVPGAVPDGVDPFTLWNPPPTVGRRANEKPSTTGIRR